MFEMLKSIVSMESDLPNTHHYMETNEDYK